MPERLDIQLFGNALLSSGGKVLDALRSPQQQSLLAYLLLHRDAPQPRHHLAFLLWPDSTESQARGQLRRLLYRIRQDLPDADAYLHTDAQTVQWRPDAPLALDVAAFEDALSTAEEMMRIGRQAQAQQALEDAVALYAGDLVPGCYDDWVRPERDRLRRAYLEALERLIALLEAGSNDQAAIQHAQRLLQYDPLHEPAYRTLMRLYARSGNRAGALRAYHTCATLLERELDVPPSPATRQAYERLLRAESASAPSPARALPLSASSPLVGRREELSRLQAAWQQAAVGQPRCALISGEAGIGKTRLAEELVRWAAGLGVAVATAHCYAAEGELAYRPVTAWLQARPSPALEPLWLREVARLLPDLLVRHPDLTPPAPMSEPWHHQRLLEALARAILGDGQPLLLILDDVQWCDRETLAWLSYLLHHAPHAPLLLVCAARLEELHDGHPFLSWLRGLRRSTTVAEIQLGPLDEAETQTLAAHVSRRPLDPELTARLYAETEGNPLFVVEMARTTGLASDRPALTPRVQATIEARLAQLSPPARALASLAAAIGRTFTLHELASAGDLDEDALIGALDELWQRRIVREHGAIAYDFTHDKLREVAYDALSPVRRRALHRHLARALETLHTSDLDPVSAQIAAHHERGGQLEQALPYLLRAAEAARRVYANEEAERYYRRVLDAPGSRAENARAVRLAALSGLGQVCQRAGKVTEAESCYREAVVLAQALRLPSREQARHYNRLADAQYYLGKYEEVVRIGEQGLALLVDDRESVEEAMLNATVALGYHYAGNPAKGREIHDRTVTFLERLPYSEELNPAYERIIWRFLGDRQTEEAIRWLGIFERAAAACGDLAALFRVHQWTGRLLGGQGDLHGALVYAQKALELALRTGYLDIGAAQSGELTGVYLRTGDLVNAARCVQDMIDAAQRAGNARHLPRGYYTLGLVRYCQGQWRQAEAALEQGLALNVGGRREDRVLSSRILGWIYLGRKDRSTALARFLFAAEQIAPETEASWKTSRSYVAQVADVLAGVEAAYADPAAFRTFCQRFLQQSPSLAETPFSQWFGERHEPGDLPVIVQDEFVELDKDWRIQDPLGDCTFEMQDGLTIYAPNGRDLRGNNASAPRLLRSPRQNADAAPWGSQTVCRLAIDDRPAMGGLLLWADPDNHLRLDWGTNGPREVRLLSRFDGQPVLIGRGRLPGDGPPGQADRIFLRLECDSDQVTSLCSTDGEEWFTVGRVCFPIDTITQVGLYAIGDIYRPVYPGAFPDGTAIHFESFQILA